MDKVQAIEKQIAALTPEQLTELRAWFAEFDAAAWDRQIEEDAASGKLDKLLDEARRDRDAGRCREI